MKTLLEHREDLRSVTAYPKLRMLLLLFCLLPGVFLLVGGVTWIFFSGEDVSMQGILFVVGGPILSVFFYAVHSIPFDIADANLNTSRSSTLHANKLASEASNTPPSLSSPPPNP